MPRPLRSSLYLRLGSVGLLLSTLFGAGVLVAGDAPRSLQEAPDPRVDSARAELRIGRYFHASELLKAADRDGVLNNDGRFLLARAEAGYKSWAGVVRVIDGAEWIDRQPGSWALLARAREAQGRRPEAIEAYLRGLDEPELPTDAVGRGEPVLHDARVRRARLARLLFEEGRPAEAIEQVDLLAQASPVLGTAVTVEAIDEAVESGDTAFVGSALLRITLPGERDRQWESMAEATLAAGDTTAARALYRSLDGEVGTDVRRSIVQEVLGDLAMADGDTTAALGHYLESLTLAPTSSAGMRSARPIVDHYDVDATLAVRAARSLDRLGDGARALRAYDLHVELAAEEGIEAEASARVERARLMTTVSSRREAGIEEYRALDEHPDPAIGARVLELWAGLRRRQGQTSNEATLRRWLIERYPNTSQAAQVVFLRADRAHDRREWDRALELYQQVADMAPTRSQAGMSRMRMGQIHLTRGNVDRARETYESYLDDFPSGARWEEASYWAARTAVDQGDSTRVVPILSRLRAEEPFDYYTVITGELVGETFEIPALPPGSLEMTTDTRRWIDDVRLLDAAGFDDVADRHVRRAIDALEESDDTQARLSLAHALNELGRTIDGINLGWQLRREDVPWSQTLLSIVYPFPFREMIEREAEEWGLDPLLVGALIRQESAFVENIKSHAGAVGLMQVMPATGAEVARGVGPANYTPASLETAEVNLHLGAKFLVDMLERFGPEIPLPLSAYNAGPTRANRWKNFPEVNELDRFTERIPFAETRGYVKNITRNLAIYRALYGERPVME